MLSLALAQVNRAGFRAGLDKCGSALLVPGGQLEMLDSNSASKASSWQNPYPWPAPA